jgi:hypothetical protein
MSVFIEAAFLYLQACSLRTGVQSLRNPVYFLVHCTAELFLRSDLLTDSGTAVFFQGVSESYLDSRRVRVVGAYNSPVVKSEDNFIILYLCNIFVMVSITVLKTLC